MHSCQN